MKCHQEIFVKRYLYSIYLHPLCPWYFHLFFPCIFRPNYDGVHTFLFRALSRFPLAISLHTVSPICPISATSSGYQRNCATIFTPMLSLVLQAFTSAIPSMMDGILSEAHPFFQPDIRPRRQQINFNSLIINYVWRLGTYRAVTTTSSSLHCRIYYYSRSCVPPINFDIYDVCGLQSLGHSLSSEDDWESIFQHRSMSPIPSSSSASETRISPWNAKFVIGTRGADFVPFATYAQIRVRKKATLLYEFVTCALKALGILEKVSRGFAACPSLPSNLVLIPEDTMFNEFLFRMTYTAEDWSDFNFGAYVDGGIDRWVATARGIYEHGL
jgi:hypothetical protein